MKKGTMLLTILGLVLMIAALPVLSACGGEEPAPAPAPAPTSEPAPEPMGALKIGITTPTTGPAAEKGAPMGHGNLDCIKYINEELGGVNGHPIEVIWLDNGYDAAKVATIVKRFMDEGCLLFSTSSSAMMSASMEIANRAGFPGIAAFSSPILYRPPQHIYGQMPDYGDDFLVFADYYMKNIWKGEGKPKMALHMLNNTTGYGARDAAKAYAESMGIDIVAMEEHSKTTTSEMESLTRIKALKPDVLYISSTPAPTALIVKNAYELGMFPGITIGSGHAGFTKALVDIAGADITEGVYGVFPTVSWGDNVPGMVKMTEYMEAEHPKDAGNMDYITTWAQSLIMAEILRVAMENVGYEALSNGDADSWALVETEGIQKLDYDVEGLHGPVKYVPGDNRLSKSVRVFQVQGGEIVPLTDWIDAPVVEYEKFDWFGN